MLDQPQRAVRPFEQGQYYMTIWRDIQCRATDVGQSQILGGGPRQAGGGIGGSRLD